MNNRIALIDGDSVVYDSGKRVEKIIEWSAEDWYWGANPEEGIELFDQLIANIVANVHADSYIIALSEYDTPNWRNGVMPTYKLARSKKHHTSRPIIWRALRDHVIANHPHSMSPGMEGDDVLGILATVVDAQLPDDRIVCSIDKDLNTIPGQLVNFRDEVGAFGYEIKDITRAHADRYHMLQTLTGDTTDGYPGCPGIGKVTAEKILQNFDAEFSDEGYLVDFDVAGCWAEVVKQYAKKGLSEAVALENARVARICRCTDFNPETKEVILWEPPRN